MAKKQVNVRLGDEAMTALTSVCESEGLTQAEAIEAALLRRATVQPTLPANGLQSAQLNRIEDHVIEIVEAVRRKNQNATISPPMPARTAATIEGGFS